MSIIGNPITVGGGSADLGTLSVTANGTYTASDDGFDGYSSVTVNVDGGDDPFSRYTDYIESSGTQYINTGYVASDNTKVEIIANVNSTNAAYAGLFGARNGDYNSATKAFLAYRDGTTLGYYIGTKPVIEIIDMSNYFDCKTKFVFDKTLYSLVNSDDINHIGAGVSGRTIDNENSLYLLNWNQSGSVFGADGMCSAKLYRACIYENDVLMLDLVPHQDSNNIVCLRDTLTDTLFYNAGSGSFTYGTDA